MQVCQIPSEEVELPSDTAPRPTHSGYRPLTQEPPDEVQKVESEHCEGSSPALEVEAEVWCKPASPRPLTPG